MSDPLTRLEGQVDAAARLLREAAGERRARARAEHEIHEEGRRAEAARVASTLREAIATLRGER